MVRALNDSKSTSGPINDYSDVFKRLRHAKNKSQGHQVQTQGLVRKRVMDGEIGKE